MERCRGQNYKYYFIGKFSQLWQCPEQITADCFVIYGLCAKLLRKSRLNKSQEVFDKGSSATTSDHQENTGYTFSMWQHGIEERVLTLESERPIVKLKFLLYPYQL